MNLKKVLFVGLGGAGQRHLRVIKKLSPQTLLYAFRTTSKTPLLTPGFAVDEKKSLQEQYGVVMTDSLAAGLDLSPDLVVISTPTSLHMQAALQAVEHGASVLVEKPFSHNLEGFEQLEKIARTKNVSVRTSFQRRLNPHFQTIKSAIQNGNVGKISSVHFAVSSHLPDWHKYEDFRQIYASRPELGGGVLLTEIHEIDLCYWFFGLPKSVYCSGGSFSYEDLPVEDTVAVVLNYDGFVVTLNIGFMNKKTRKEMQLNGSDISFEWTEANNLLKTSFHRDNREDSQSLPFSGPDELFEKQFTTFMQNGLDFSQDDFNVGKMSVLIVEAARQSMRTGQAVRIQT